MMGKIALNFCEMTFCNLIDAFIPNTAISIHYKYTANTLANVCNNMPLRQLPRPTEYQYLPEYHIDNITSANARIDLAEIHFTGLDIQAATRAGLQEYVRDQFAESALFTRIHNNRTKTRSGWLLIIPTASINTESTYCPITFKLVLNFSRFYQSNSGQIDNNSEAALVFRPNDVRLDAAKSYSLERKKNDNILIGSAWRNSRNTASLFALMVHKAQELVETFIPVPPPHSHDDIRELSLNGSVLPNILESKVAVPLFDWSTHHFKKLEVYWDFQHENAIGFVNHIRHNLVTAAESVFDRIYSSASGRNASSPAVTIPLPRKMELIVYAKTHRRIRFEIRFKGSFFNYFRRELEELGLQPNNLSDLPRCVEFAQDYASQTLRRIIHATQRRRVPAFNNTALNLSLLMRRFYESTNGNIHLMEEILAELIHNRVVIANERTRDTLDYLATHEVIVRTKIELRSRTRRYVVHQHYDLIFRQLRAKPITPR